jgi:hypothetical protein
LNGTRLKARRIEKRVLFTRGERRLAKEFALTHLSTPFWQDLTL